MGRPAPAALPAPRETPRATLDATASSSVDLPTPGSPASRTTAPGTSPPPSTRSSSPTPVGACRAASTSICPISRAVERVGATATVRGPTPAAPTSATVPHSWHSPHRPTHLAVVQPHAVHANAGRAVLAWERAARALVVVTRATLAVGADTSRPPRPADTTLTARSHDGGTDGPRRGETWPTPTSTTCERPRSTTGTARSTPPSTGGVASRSGPPPASSRSSWSSSSPTRGPASPVPTAARPPRPSP